MLAVANGSNYLCYIIASDKTKLSSETMILVTRPENNKTFRYSVWGVHDATKYVRRSAGYRAGVLASSKESFL
jgi:hypothetical protein